MTDLYIVRHGNTFEAGEAPRRIGSRTDLPLTAAGLDQANALGAHFAALGIRFAAAFTSPLQRTRWTAEAILSHRPHPPVLEAADFLSEIDHGPDENQAEDTVLARIGQRALEQWDHAATPPEGWDVRPEWRRGQWQDFAADAVSQHAGEAILLVTSNGAARFALSGLGIDPAPGQSIKLRTGSYGHIDAIGDQFRLVSWDQRPAVAK